jgi:hypothetical protein
MSLIFHLENFRLFNKNLDIDPGSVSRFSIKPGSGSGFDELDPQTL